MTLFYPHWWKSHLVCVNMVELKIYVCKMCSVFPVEWTWVFTVFASEDRWIGLKTRYPIFSSSWNCLKLSVSDSISRSGITSLLVQTKNHDVYTPWFLWIDVTDVAALQSTRSWFLADTCFWLRILHHIFLLYIVYIYVMHNHIYILYTLHYTRVTRQLWYMELLHWYTL